MGDFDDNTEHEEMKLKSMGGRQASVHNCLPIGVGTFGSDLFFIVYIGIIEIVLFTILATLLSLFSILKHLIIILIKL